jgi:hypothetical protein
MTGQDIFLDVEDMEVVLAFGDGSGSGSDDGTSVDEDSRTAASAPVFLEKE